MRWRGKVKWKDGLRGKGRNNRAGGMSRQMSRINVERNEREEWRGQEMKRK